ncbi:MAG: O-antigen ligase family protein [Patescibacteria group bacterium]
MALSRYLTKLNIVFAMQLILVALAVLDVLPREAFLFSAGIFVLFALFEPIEETVFLIARSIPILVALPITDTFDSLNMWRLIVLIIFLKWFFDSQFADFFENLKTMFAKIGKPLEMIKFAWSRWRMEFLAALLFLISILSLLKADDLGIAVKRIIYFVNLGMLFFVIRATTSKENLKRLAWNVLISGIIVVAVGIIQLVTSYLIYIDNFAEFWALQFNQTLYGAAWANIAVNANTWFAYYYDTIHLRMFASFPDTHSFPLYLLIIICFAITLVISEKRKQFKYALYFFIALASAGLILSGTRGIWASIVFPIMFLIYLLWKKYADKSLLAYAAIPLIFFIALLPFSYIVFSSTQFKLKQSAQHQSVLRERIKSIIDTNETSNQGRIHIWKETLKSIAQNPLLGVGIGNFPTVLKQNPTATKAGSSAHNLYLNTFAELGIFGFIIFMMLTYEILKSAWKLFAGNQQPFERFFGLNAVIYLIWILWYSMTDVAIYDERAFLLLMILLGAIFAMSKNYANPSGFNQSSRA